MNSNSVLPSPSLLLTNPNEPSFASSSSSSTAFPSYPSPRRPARSSASPSTSTSALPSSSSGLSTLSPSASSSSTSQTGGSSKSVLTIALQRAQSAVLLDQANNVLGAISAYSTSVRLLSEVMERVENGARREREREEERERVKGAVGGGGEEEQRRRKARLERKEKAKMEEGRRLMTIRDTYEDRIRMLIAIASETSPSEGQRALAAAAAGSAGGSTSPGGLQAQPPPTPPFSRPSYAPSSPSPFASPSTSDVPLPRVRSDRSLVSQPSQSSLAASETNSPSRSSSSSSAANLNLNGTVNHFSTTTTTSMNSFPRSIAIEEEEEEVTPRPMQAEWSPVARDIGAAMLIPSSSPTISDDVPRSTNVGSVPLAKRSASTSTVDSSRTGVSHSYYSAKSVPLLMVDSEADLLERDERTNGRGGEGEGEGEEDEGDESPVEGFADRGKAARWREGSKSSIASGRGGGEGPTRRDAGRGMRKAINLGEGEGDREGKATGTEEERLRDSKLSVSSDSTVTESRRGIGLGVAFGMPSTANDAPPSALSTHVYSTSPTNHHNHSDSSSTSSAEGSRPAPSPPPPPPRTIPFGFSSTSSRALRPPPLDLSVRQARNDPTRRVASSNMAVTMSDPGERAGPPAAMVATAVPGGARGTETQAQVQATQGTPMQRPGMRRTTSTADSLTMAKGSVSPRSEVLPQLPTQPPAQASSRTPPTRSSRSASLASPSTVAGTFESTSWVGRARPAPGAGMVLPPSSPPLAMGLGMGKGYARRPSTGVEHSRSASLSASSTTSAREYIHEDATADAVEEEEEDEGVELDLREDDNAEEEEISDPDGTSTYVVVRPASVEPPEANRFPRSAGPRSQDVGKGYSSKSLPVRMRSVSQPNKRPVFQNGAALFREEPLPPLPDLGAGVHVASRSVSGPQGAGARVMAPLPPTPLTATSATTTTTTTTLGAPPFRRTSSTSSFGSAKSEREKEPRGPSPYYQPLPLSTFDAAPDTSRFMFPPPSSSALSHSPTPSSNLSTHHAPSFPTPPPLLEPFEVVSPVRRPFQLMKQLLLSIEGEGSGAYVTPKLYIPKYLWSQSGVKLVAVETKVRMLLLLSSGIEGLEKAGMALLRRGGNAVVGAQELREYLEGFEGMMFGIQSTLEKKLGYNTGGKKTGTTSFSAWSSKLSRSLDRVTNGRSLDSPATYVEAIGRVCRQSQIIDQHLLLLSENEAGYSRLTPLERQQISEGLARASDFFSQAICRFILRDLGMLIEKYVKRSGVAVGVE